MNERWSATAVDNVVVEGIPSGPVWAEGNLAPIVGHHVVGSEIFAFADGYSTPEGAVQALTTYLATVNRPQSRAPLTERNHLS